jgi:geranylgeranyl pyrophosphate synthase
VITAVPVEFLDSALEAEVLDDLARVEDLLTATAHPDDQLLTEASRHSIAAGGKRFRAMLVLLAARFGDPADPRVIQAAVAMELTHLATLFHDDVMDEALVRRGSPSANSRWGNSVAILTGDFLFAQASQILADLGPQAVRIQAQTFSRLVAGQMAETVGPHPDQDPLEFYMQVITEKTGSLIATSGQFGALFSRPDRGAYRGRLRTARGGLAAVRRRDRRRQRLGAVRQDARHRPAPGGPDAAGSVRAAFGRDLAGGRTPALAARRGGPDPATPPR